MDLPDKEMKDGIRKSRMFLNEVYFWTDTIKDWNKLLTDDYFKRIIINSWQTLVERRKIIIYGFVIMPNHIHVIWEMSDMNGKEMPHASFNKFTSHRFLESIRSQNLFSLANYEVIDDVDRHHRFWQRDPLAVKMDSREKVEQKLEYIHLNPLQEHWSLVTKPEDYRWSSARFYETGFDEFNFLTDYRVRF
ncbi:MAG: transposase [Cyclobacteriaceae bacterium]|jgi:putative transposase|nr:transposase [Flammeovirgaceae bacterium]